jgi:5-methylcytosine-specific restriction protein A
MSEGLDGTEPRDPPWTRDELILVCEALRQNGWKLIRASDPRAIVLTELLRALPIHPLERRTPRFRSPSSVQRKGADILTRLPEYGGKPTRGGRLDAEVLADFLGGPTVMSAAAEALKRERSGGSPELIQLPSPENDEYEAPEGHLLYRRHLIYERSRALRLKRIHAASQINPRLECEACSFGFGETYGSIGEGYIQVHHVVPLHESHGVRTRLSDLALLCANCHVMAHRVRPWPSVAELRGLIRSQTNP